MTTLLLRRTTTLAPPRSASGPDEQVATRVNPLRVKQALVLGLPLPQVQLNVLAGLAAVSIAVAAAVTSVLASYVLDRMTARAFAPQALALVATLLIIACAAMSGVMAASVVRRLQL